MIINVEDVFERVVNEMRLTWDSESLTPEKPFFMYGSYQEMINTLVSLDGGKLTKYKKYPLIMLPMPYDCEETESGVKATISPVIIARSKADIKTAERYTYTFNPTLYPLMQLLKSELELSREINEMDIKLKWTDHPYWKTDGAANMGTDYVDAIEIRNLELNFLKSC